MENLKTLVYGRKLNDYQRALAQKEFEAIENNLVKFGNYLLSKERKNNIFHHLIKRFCFN